MTDVGTGVAARLRAGLARLPGQGLLRWLGRYTAHDDPLVAIAGKIAAIVVSNQPFYPLYLLAILGAPGIIGCWTWLTTPFFAAVPAVARRNPTAGRILMCGAGMANTLLCQRLLGSSSGVGWFALPCILLAVVTFRAREWPIAISLAGACILGALAAPALIPAPVLPLDASALAALTKLHVISVVSLLCVIAYLRVRRVGGP